MAVTETTVVILFQRTGGRCEPVQENAFPFPEPVMKVTRVVSFIVRFERPF